MNAPLPESIRRALESVTLDDKYTLDSGRAFMSGVQVALALQHRQSHQSLHTAHEGASRFEGVLVVESDGFERLADRLGQRCIHGDDSWEKAPGSAAV